MFWENSSTTKEGNGNKQHISKKYYPIIPALGQSECATSYYKLQPNASVTVHSLQITITQSLSINATHATLWPYHLNQEKVMCVVIQGRDALRKLQ